MLAKRFNNVKLEIELTSYVDNKQNIWFLGKDIANILGYSDTDKAIRKHVDEEDKYKGPAKTAGGLQQSFFINELFIYLCLNAAKRNETKDKWFLEFPSTASTGAFVGSVF